jgi:putative membrane protein
MNFIIRILITAAVAWGLSSLLSGVHVADFKTALIFAVVLAVLNAIVKPILALLTLPITLITLGLWLFVLNAIIILIADRFIDGIKIDGILWAIIFSLLLSVLSSILSAIFDRK